jgi:hypothetical protein
MQTNNTQAPLAAIVLFLIVHINNGYMNVSQYYILHTFSTLLP